MENVERQWLTGLGTEVKDAGVFNLDLVKELQSKMSSVEILL